MKALPTYGVIPAINMILKLAKEGKQAPGMHYGLDRILHGEQYTELLRPLPTHAKLTHRARILDIWDKGKGAVVVTEVKSYDEHGDELIQNEITSFVRGAGGWGGERGPSSDVNAPPDRAPDAVVTEKIPENAGPALPAERRLEPAPRRPGLRQGVRLRSADPARPVHLRLRGAARAREVRARGQPATSSRASRCASPTACSPARRS